jgi:hypothetical protein
MRRRNLHRHARWAIPVVGAAGAWSVVVWAAQYEQAHPDGRGAAYALIVLGGAASMVLTLACLILAVRNGWRTRKAIVRERLHAVVRYQQQIAYANGWQAAHSLAAQLAAGKPPAPLTTRGLVLRPRETAYLDLNVDVSQRVTNFIGEPRWSVPTTAQVVATDQRLLINTGRWCSVPYADVLGFYPDLDEWQVTVDPVGAPAFRLAGPLALVIAVYLAAMIFGHEQWKRGADVVR